MSAVNGSLELIPQHLRGVHLQAFTTLPLQKVDFIFLKPFCGGFTYITSTKFQVVKAHPDYKTMDDGIHIPHQGK